MKLLILKNNRKEFTIFYLFLFVLDDLVVESEEEK